MSSQTRISKLNINIKKRISWVLRQNGFMNEDIELILSQGESKGYFRLY